MKNYQDFVTQSFPKILCVGKNYLKHIKQMGGADAPENPVLFMKSWSSLAYNPKKLFLPHAKTHKIDHEVQLGVFINKGGKNILPQKVGQHIGGYFLAIDMTDRDLQSISKKNGWPWQIGKSQDNFCPVSSLFKKNVDPYSIELQLSVNGQLRQKGITGDMHFKINEILSYASSYISLNEGDLILTGTPSGVGPLKAGDHVQAFAKIKDQVLEKLDFIIE